MKVRGFEFARKRVDGKVVVEDGTEVRAFPEAKIPVYSSPKAAGADFFCAEEVVIPSMWKKVAEMLFVEKNLRVAVNIVCDHRIMYPTKVHTGIKAYMQDDEVLELYNRSGNPFKLGLVLANSVGVVDADYYNSEDSDGEIVFAFYNFFPWDAHLHVGDKIGQGVFKKFLRPDDAVVSDKERVGGFGSTGK